MELVSSLAEEALDKLEGEIMALTSRSDHFTPNSVLILQERFKMSQFFWKTSLRNKIHTFSSAKFIPD
jgi:hypothetical protein